MYKERESRLKSLHQEEMEELTSRLRVANDKLLTAKADHEDDLERERERRLKDLARQADDHRRAVEDLRSEYAATLDKVKELKAYELNSTRDAADVTK